MKFSLTAFFIGVGLSTTVFGAPSGDIKQLVDRQTSVVSVITGAVNSLSSTLQTSEIAILAAANSVQNNVEATVEIQIKANLQAIAGSLQNTGSIIANATAGAVGGLESSAAGLSQTEIQALTQALVKVGQLILGITATLTVTATKLPSLLVTAIQTEISTLKSAVSLLVTPLLAFVSAAANLQPGISVGLLGLGSATSVLESIIKLLLGAQGISF